MCKLLLKSRPKLAFASAKMRLFNINTSNAKKLEQYRNFCVYNEAIVFRPTVVDLREPDTTDIYTVVRYKATQMPGVIVEDVSFEIDHPQAFNPVCIKWNLEKVQNFVGSKATMTILLGQMEKDGGESGNENVVRIYKSSTKGKLVEKRIDNVNDNVNDNEFGFDPWFLPENSKCTLSEMPAINRYNPRYKAYLKWLNDNCDNELKPLYEWDGSFQKHF